MAEITLGDYTGYIFLEIIKARGLADQYSSEVAAMYARDDILKFFSVPRFKIPNLELTIPVLISGARFRQTVTFRMKQEDFANFVWNRADNAVRTVLINTDGWFHHIEPQRERRVGRSPTVDALITGFYDALVGNTDPLHPSAIVSTHWAQVLKQALVEAELLDAYTSQNPKDELLKQTTNDVLSTITANTSVDRTTIESLLINPETQVVRDGSSDATVFTIKAEMMEENFFIRAIKDDDTGTVTRVVEFE